MKKIHRQLAAPMIAPPSSGPNTGASSIGTPITLITRPIRCGPAAWARMVCPMGRIIPAPSPCSTRKAISDPSRPGRPGEHRTRQEQQQREDPRPPGAEPLGRPPGQRDDGGEGEHVAGHHPLDRRDRGAQVAREGGDGDVHDRQVEDRHDRPQDDDAGEHEDLPAQPVARPVGVRCVRAGVAVIAAS
jgi:hypothetical protein